MKWVSESKACSRESVVKGLAKGFYNLNNSSEWFLTPLSSCSSSRQARRTFGLKGVSAVKQGAPGKKLFQRKSTVQPKL